MHHIKVVNHSEIYFELNSNEPPRWQPSWPRGAFAAAAAARVAMDAKPDTSQSQRSLSQPASDWIRDLIQPSLTTS